MALREEAAAPPPAGTEPAGEDGPVAVELAFILGLAGLTAAIAWQALALPAFAPDGTVGPGFFPIPVSLLLLAGLVLYAAALLFKLFRDQARDRVGAERLLLFNARQFATLAILAIAVLIGGTIGLFATVGLILFAGLLSVERLKLLESLAFTVGALIVVYLIFDAWLGMNIGLNGIL